MFGWVVRLLLSLAGIVTAWSWLRTRELRFDTNRDSYPAGDWLLGRGGLLANHQ